MGSYIKPQPEVFQEFNVTPSEIAEPLRAHISGGHAYLLRHSQAAERLASFLGGYDPLGGLVASWPGRPAGSLVDGGYTRVFVDSAILPYYTRAIGAGSVVTPTGAAAPDRIVAADNSGGFKANGTANPRYVGLAGRDAVPGDSVRVHGVVGGQDYTLDTYIRALESAGVARVAAAVNVPTLDSLDPPTQSASAVVSAGIGNTSNSAVVASATQYKPYANGRVADTYTITVIRNQIGSDPTTAALQVASASGLDNTPVVIVGADGVPFPVGSLGLSVTITRNVGTPQGLAIGQSWTIAAAASHTCPAPTAGGTYTGTSAVTYIVEVIRGGYFGVSTDAGRPAIAVSTNTGVDASAPITVPSASASLPIGTRGVTFSVSVAGTPIGLRKGDRYYVSATPSADGAFRTIALGHNLPPALLAATDLDLRLSIRRDIVLPAGAPGLPGIMNWTQSATQLAIAAGATALDPLGGSTTALPVAGGDVHVEYRAWRSDLVGQVNSITDVGDLNTNVAGPLHPDNPLKWGIYKALANANGTAVKYTAVADPSSLDSWDDVLHGLVGREDVYNLVPLTHRRDVVDLYAAHVVDQSGPDQGRWRAMFASLQLVTTLPMVSAATSTDADVVLATLADDPNSAGQQFTILTVPGGNATFHANGVLPGDIARYFYTQGADGETFGEFVVDAVLNESTLRLAVGAGAPSTTARKLEVWHPLSKIEQAAGVGTRSGSLGSTRVVSVWPDVVGEGGLNFPGYYLGCALAGLASGIVPHQGMTHLEVVGFDDVSRASVYFNSAQLDRMAGSGTTVVTQANDGRIYVRDSLTTLDIDVNHSQEMVRRNLDSMSMLFLRRLSPFIGVANVTRTAIDRIYVELVSAIEFLKANGFTETLGSQLIEGKVVQLRPHVLLKDRIVGVLALTVPYSLDNIECHLVV